MQSMAISFGVHKMFDIRPLMHPNKYWIVCMRACSMIMFAGTIGARIEFSRYTLNVESKLKTIHISYGIDAIKPILISRCFSFYFFYAPRIELWKVFISIGLNCAQSLLNRKKHNDSIQRLYKDRRREWWGVMHVGARGRLKQSQTKQRSFEKARNWKTTTKRIWSNWNNGTTIRQQQQRKTNKSHVIWNFSRSGCVPCVYVCVCVRVCGNARRFAPTHTTPNTKRRAAAAAANNETAYNIQHDTHTHIHTLCIVYTYIYTIEYQQYKSLEILRDYKYYFDPFARRIWVAYNKMYEWSGARSVWIVHRGDHFMCMKVYVNIRVERNSFVCMCTCLCLCLCLCVKIIGISIDMPLSGRVHDSSVQTWIADIFVPLFCSAKYKLSS